jgi:hypothetical protein
MAVADERVARRAGRVSRPTAPSTSDERPRLATRLGQEDMPESRDRCQVRCRCWSALDCRQHVRGRHRREQWSTVVGRVAADVATCIRSPLSAETSRGNRSVRRQVAGAVLGPAASNEAAARGQVNRTAPHRPAVCDVMPVRAGTVARALEVVPRQANLSPQQGSAARAMLRQPCRPPVGKRRHRSG